MRSNLKSPTERPIHILEVIGNAIVGGVENYVYNLVQNLPSYGFKITCLAPFESAYTMRLRELGADLYVTQMHVDVPWRSLQLASAVIRHHEIDLLHAHLPRAHALAGLAGKLTGRPAVATFHGMELTAEELGLAQLTGTHLITVCQQAYSQALSLGMPPARVSMIPNGVDTRGFSPARSSRAFRETFQIPPDAPLVGFVGRISFEKGPDHFVRMAAHVHEKRPDVHFVITGEGPMENEIRALIQELDVSAVVHLAGLGKNMPEIYPAFDLLAQTSRVEGMPFALLEAMASGLPVAAMSVGGVADIIEVGSTGLTSAPEDWYGLGEGVLKLLANPPEMKRMGLAGRRRVEAQFDLYNSLQQVTSLFQSLVKLETPASRLLPSEWGIAQPQTDDAALPPPGGKTIR